MCPNLPFKVTGLIQNKKDGKELLCMREPGKSLKSEQTYKVGQQSLITV